MIKRHRERGRIFVNTSFTQNENKYSYLLKIIFLKYIIHFPLKREIIKQIVYSNMYQKY
jgi:hypothetical protein